MYAYLGPQMAASPLQVGYIKTLLSRAHGVILELGPGNGDQTHHFNPDKIERIYGAEPNAHFYPALMTKAKDAGLDGRYIPINAGAQPDSLLPALREAGVLPRNSSSLPEEGIFDSIVAVKSMCSAPQSQMLDTLVVIRALLKPGGEFLFFEHLQNDTSRFTQCYAWLFDIFLWPALMGGCRLNGKLDKVLIGMSGWEKKEIKNIAEHKGHEIFRYTKGVCTKA